MSREDESGHYIRNAVYHWLRPFSRDLRKPRRPDWPTSPLWMLMSWREIGTRPSATNMQTSQWVYCHTHDFTWLRYHVKLNICSREIRMSATRWFLCYRRVRLLTCIMRYDWQKTEYLGSPRRLSIMTMSSNEEIFRVNGPLWGETAGHVELWCFLWSAPEQTVEQTLDTRVILDAMWLIMTSL